MKIVYKILQKMNERRRRSPVPVPLPMEIDENLPRNGLCDDVDVTPQNHNPKATNPLQDCSNRTNRQPQGSRKRKSNEMEDGQPDDPNISGPNQVSDEDDGGINIGDIHIPPPMQTAAVQDEKGPRLIISHIVNVDFKSYAGRVVLGPFHQSFTAIVGPNGSGKSNVIDSMLFVFGYRASKIRSKKISVLLHSSSRYPNVTTCTVEVHFAKIQNKEDGSGYDVVPGSKFVVSRTAFKDNSSFYQLDGRRTHFKEVGALLRSQGIDLDHNRFLILQGEVEQIAMMRPKALNEHDSGMLEYLEDIVGTSRYKVPLGQLGERVEQLTEARSERLNRVRLAEADKVRLEPAMREAVELLNVSNQSIRCRNTLLQKYIHETEKVIKEKTATLVQLKKKLTELEEELKKAKLEMREKNNTLKENSREYETLKSQKEELDDKVKVLARKSQNLQNELTQAKKKLKNLTTNTDKENTHMAVLRQIPEKNANEIEECEKLKETLIKKKAEKQKEYEEVLANIRTQTQGLQETKDGLQAQLIDLKRTQNQASQKHKLAESELKLYVSTEVSEKDKVERMTNALTAANQALKDGEKTLNELSSSLPQKRKELQEAQKELEQNRQEERRLQEQIRLLQQRLDESRENASASHSRGRIIDSLMQLQKQGKLRGIFGRLGDLGAIDTKYDVAISTCCPQLDNILVEEAETGQKCVEHLKKNRLGIGHFIIREKVMDKESRMYQAGPIPENVPRLFELVQVADDRVKVAFYHVLGDTLCTEQMEQATRIAYGRQRYRVVTIRGDVIELSGTISGGGNRKLQGKMGRTVREDTREQKQDAESMKRDEARLEEMEQRLQALRERQRVLEETVRGLMQTLPQTDIQIQKLKMDIKSHTEQIPTLQRQLKEQVHRAEQCRVDPKKKKTLEEAAEAAEKLLEEAKDASAEVEKEVEEVDRQISAVAGGQVKVMKKSIDDLGKKIEKIGSEVVKLNVAITSSKRDIEKSEQKLRQWAADKTETEKHIESLQGKRSALNTEAEQARKELLEAEQKLEDGTSDFSELRAEIEALVGRENAIKSEVLEVSNAVSKEQKSVQDVRDKIPSWSGELSRTKLEDPGVTGVEGIEPVAPLTKHSAEELEAVDISELRGMIEGHKNRLNGLKPNLNAIQEYKSMEEVYLKRAADLDAVTTQRNELRTVQEQLRKRRTTEFLAGFNTITGKLKEMYQMITLGGDAELELVDSLDPFTEGIVFSVRPPNKSWKNISNLSGGEKTLSSLALVFALHYYKPTPLYVMDEIDAALDFKNVSIVANYITERTKNAQFIIISLRYNMFEVCNRLVGIYKTQDCTKCLAIENVVAPSRGRPTQEPIANGPTRTSGDNFFANTDQVAS